MSTWSNRIRERLLARNTVEMAAKRVHIDQCILSSTASVKHRVHEAYTTTIDAASQSLKDWWSDAHADITNGAMPASAIPASACEVLADVSVRVTEVYRAEQAKLLAALRQHPSITQGDCGDATAALLSSKEATLMSTSDLVPSAGESLITNFVAQSVEVGLAGRKS